MKTASQTPRANGQVEQVNRTVLLGLRTLTDDIDCENWDLKLLEVQWSINHTEHKVTKVAPTKINFRHKLNKPNQNMLNEEIEKVNEDKGREIEIDFDDISKKIKEDQEKQKLNYDKKRKIPPCIEEGSLVMVTVEIPATGESRKLRERYNGPYIVKSKLSNDRYIVEDIPGERKKQKPYSACIAVDRLKVIN